MGRQKLSSLEDPGVRSKSKHKQLAIIGIIAFLVACAIGFGVGFGYVYPQREKGNEAKNNTTTIPTTPIPPSGGNVWKPAIGSKWQIVLPNPIDLPVDATNTDPPDAQIWDIDLFINSNQTISTLHRLGKKVICYFSAGSYEQGRPDSDQFKPEDMGKVLKGWPGEKWLDLNSKNVRQIMTNRIQLAKAKGCDGIDPDNVDAYDNDNGLNLSPLDSINFIAFLASKAHQAGMSLGLKNGGDILPSVVLAVEWSVNEQCVQMAECDKYAPMIGHGKPVFHIEYPNQVKTNNRILSSLCSDDGQAQGAANFSTMLKNDNLDGWVQYCDGTTTSTPEDSS